jgi:hypothetical protein
MANRSIKSIVFIVVLLSIFVSILSYEPLTFEQRVKAQEAIERVYYNHRIWPKENKDPKPPFEKMVPKEVIEKKVEDYLKKSSALETYWYRPITGEQLQAEMDRMAKNTKDPKVLNELFEALNNNPYLIAECLARPVLADRLIRNWYANDERFHKKTKEMAEEALRHLTPENFCSYPEGEHFAITYKLQIDGKEELYSDPEDHSIKLPEKEFYRIYNEIPEEGKISKVIEKDDCFVILHTVEKNEGLIIYDSIVFKKTSLENWLKDQSVKKENVIAKSEKVYSLSPLKESQCGERWDNGILDDLDRLHVRACHTAVWTGTEMIVWGGTEDGYTQQNVGYRYNPYTDWWTVTSTGLNCPAPRYFHSAIWTGTDMIIWGGYNYDNGNNIYYNNGAKYNPESDSWVSISDGSQCPVGRCNHTAVWTGVEMIIWGGNNYNNGEIYLNSGGRYNPIADNWVTVSLFNCPVGRNQHSAVWTGSEMIVWGGYDGTGCLNSGAKYDPILDLWTPTSQENNVPTQRKGHSAIWTGIEMIVWGGQSSTCLNSGGKYNPVSDTWISTSTGTFCPTDRFQHTAVWTGEEMIIWGGRCSGALNTGGKYTPSTDMWLPTSVGANCPTARYYTTAIWTGNEMIIWGGYSGGVYMNSGSRYLPALDSWVPTALFSGLSERKLHSAVWTGSEMIIWGGSDQNSVLSSGGKYNSATDSWGMTSTGSGCPSPRHLHTANWTGTEMIIWGGIGQYGHYFNTGGKYNPLSDNWTLTTSLDAPVSRAYHSSVWTGSEMIIWGGITNNYQYLNSGGKYQPYEDMWTVIATTNAPVARCCHSAIWTGSEMIIWGGYNANNHFNDGKKYNPLTEVWSSMSSENCPFGFCGQSAIWTGEEMIVWGGNSTVEPYHTNTGSRYNPQYDRWTLTSVEIGAPEKRGGHTAIWTGYEMIIWGGINDNNNRLNSGSLYSPANNTWREMISDYNCPVARNAHTAVWAEECMIIFGGSDGSSALQSGGIYYPGFVKPLISGGSTNICPSPSVSLSVPGDYVSYQWNLDGVPIEGATSNICEATVSGNYTVSVTDSEGCSGTSDTHPVTIVACVPEIIYDSKGSFTEVTGNGNSYFEKGEKWKVSVIVRNSGNTPATNVVANLTGNGIQVCNNPGVFGTIPAGGTASYEFEFLIDSNFSPCGGYIDFGLINKQCVEKTPAGNDEFNLFSIQVGEITLGVPTELVIQPSSIDSWVNQASQNGNYGSDTSIYVQARNLQARRLLVQFDLSSIPLNSTINSATLELYATSTTGSNTIELHRITSGWTESGVTWNNQPSYDAAIVSSLTSSGTGWKVWDVKSLIEGYLSGTFTNCGFLLKSQTETGAQLISTTFASRENSNTSQRPILRINYTPPTSMNCDYVGNGECLIPLPGEVAPGDNYNNALIWSEDKATINWPAVSGVTTYKVYRGIKSSLPALLTSAIDSCLRYQDTTTSVDLSSDNPSSDSDKMYWYLVIGSNSSGDGPAGNGRIVNSGGSCQ